MKRIKLILTFLALICYSPDLLAQDSNCSCQADLQFLNEKIRKTPSYKLNRDSYNTAFKALQQNVKSAKTIYECGRWLNTLLISLNDNHSKVYSANPGATDEIKNEKEEFEKFKKTPLYNTYSKTSFDLDSLKQDLSEKSIESIEGVYFSDDYTIGVYRTGGSSSFELIILSSNSELWQKGEILGSLIRSNYDQLLFVGGSIKSKRFIAFEEKVSNGFFSRLNFRKNLTRPNYANRTLSDENYYIEDLSDDITYLKIGSFNSFYPVLGEAEKFYSKIKEQLVKRNLILDLRNNSGGGDRNSDILLKILKKYSKNNKVYVLINFRTTSNAEQFALKLKELKNTILLGEPTNGTIAYEIKNSSYNMPCNNFIAVLTSKKHKNYIKYEGKGIEPDIRLQPDSEWPNQVELYISNSQS